MERELLVYLDIDRVPVLVGRLWARERTGGETSSFVYDPTWIRRRGAFALAPSLYLRPVRIMQRRDCSAPSQIPRPMPGDAS